MNRLIEGYHIPIRQDPIVPQRHGWQGQFQTADYMFVLTADESKFLRSKFSSLEHGGKGRHSKYNYKAFTEKGLYMLATVLKSRRATEATFAIIETFAIAWRRGFQPRPLP